MKNPCYRMVAVALAATLVGACGVDEVLAPVPAAREPAPPFRHESFYESLSGCNLQLLYLMWCRQAQL